jgi:hypothetical protein
VHFVNRGPNPGAVLTKRTSTVRNVNRGPKLRALLTKCTASPPSGSFEPDGATT